MLHALEYKTCTHFKICYLWSTITLIIHKVSGIKTVTLDLCLGTLSNTFVVINYYKLQENRWTAKVWSWRQYQVESCLPFETERIESNFGPNDRSYKVIF